MSTSDQIGLPRSDRWMSLDALRGFDMFWIVGADAMGHALARVEGGPVVGALARQLDHVAWEGFRFYDLIFPLFAFLIGVAITLSLPRVREREGRPAAVWRVIRRALLLYLLGLFYYGGLSTPLEHIRYVGVLQRLAFAYLGAGLIFLFLDVRGLVGALIGLLLGYWAVLALVPIRDVRLDAVAFAELAEQQGKPELAAVIRDTRNPSVDPDRRAWNFAEETYAATSQRVRGSYEPGRNLANHLDFVVLPGKKWDGYYDPEGLLSNVPAVASALLGVLAGLWLQRRDRSPIHKVGWLATAGLAGIALGFLWGLEFPVVKKLWSSSYVLVAGGYSVMLLAGFYLVIDVWKVRTWALPLVWIGANPLTIYLLSNVVDFEALAERFAGGDVALCLEALWPGLGALTLALVGAAICVGVCWFLYARNIFLRL